MALDSMIHCKFELRIKVLISLLKYHHARSFHSKKRQNSDDLHSMNQPGQCNQKLLRQVLNRHPGAHQFRLSGVRIWLSSCGKMLSHTSMLSHTTRLSWFSAHLLMLGSFLSSKFQKCPAEALPSSECQAAEIKFHPLGQMCLFGKLTQCLTSVYSCWKIWSSGHKTESDLS